MNDMDDVAPIRATKHLDLGPEPPLDPADVGDIICMALSDHVSFAQIRAAHGLSPDQVKVLMRRHLSPGSYRAWRRRVRRFVDQRAVYK
jgi:uncharacterized protein (TIGR03643 family)